MRISGTFRVMNFLSQDVVCCCDVTFILMAPEMHGAIVQQINSIFPSASNCKRQFEPHLVFIIIL